LRRLAARGVVGLEHRLQVADPAAIERGGLGLDPGLFGFGLE